MDNVVSLESWKNKNTKKGTLLNRFTSNPLKGDRKKEESLQTYESKKNSKKLALMSFPELLSESQLIAKKLSAPRLSKPIADYALLMIEEFNNRFNTSAFYSNDSIKKMQQELKKRLDQIPYP